MEQIRGFLRFRLGRAIVLAIMSTIWKKVPMKMIVIFGSLPSPKTATASAPKTGAGM
jgi:hypothetical protein